MIKQVIVIRKDLNMRKGKMCAQASHASMKIFFDRMGFFRNTQRVGRNPSKNYPCYDVSLSSSWEGEIHLTDKMYEWFTGKFTKICVSVDSEQELLDIYNKAKEAGLPVALIEDDGLTEFNGVVTKTCLAIGPDEADKIDQITGGLKLL